MLSYSRYLMRTPFDKQYAIVETQEPAGVKHFPKSCKHVAAGGLKVHSLLSIKIEILYGTFC